MSDATPTTLQSPTRGDVVKLIAQLRDDQTSEVRAEVADRLVVFAAHERHPRAKGALLERAANLVGAADPERELLLLREAFRQHPRFEIGERLCQAAEDDEALSRLGRLGHLFDAVAALAPEDERSWALLRAARAHISLGHGTRAVLALEALDALGEPVEAMAGEPGELREIAASQREDRHEVLTAKRMEIAEATGTQRGAVLLEYAQLLLAGDEPLADVSAVLADAVDSGAEPQEAAPLWAEVARAVGDPEMLGRALAASLDCEQPMHERLRTADELANRFEVDQRQPDVAQRALEVLSEALPDDLGVQARLLALRAIGGEIAASLQLDQLRLHTVKQCDRDGEALVCLALARVAIQGGNDDQAERYMRRVRTLDPRNNVALDFFEARFRAAGDVKRLYMVLSHRLPGAAGEEAVRIARAMAELAEGEMDSPDRAIEAWHRVLAGAPNHPEATDALVRLYGANQRWTELRDVLERRANQAEAAGDEEALADALSRRADLHGKDAALADPSAHVTLLRRVARLDVERPGLDEAFDEALAAVEAWQELAERLALRLNDPDRGRAAARTLLRITTESYDATGLATRALNALVAMRPAGSTAAGSTEGDDAHDDPTAHDPTIDDRAIEQAARKLGDDRHLVTALTWRRRHSDDDAAVTVLEEAAALAAWALDDKLLAISLFEDLRELRPAHPAALRGLSRLYGAVGRADEQVGVLEVLLDDDRLSDGERGDLLEQLAGAHAEGRGDLSAAQSTVARLLTLRPTSPLGQKLAQRAAVASGDVDSLRAALGDGDDAAETFVSQLEAMAADLEGVAAVAPLRAAAQSAALELQQPERAVELCGLALLHTTDSEDDELATAVATELLALAESAQDDAWLEQALATLAARGPARASTRRQLAERAEDRDDWGEARAAWQQAMADAATADDLISDTDRLCEAAERAGESEGVVAAVAAAVARLRDAAPDAAQAALIAVAAWAAGEGVDLDAALEAIDAEMSAATSTATADNAHVALLVARERLLVEQGNWPEVVVTLERLAQTLQGEEKVEALRRAAGICDGVAHDPTSAARLYETIVSLAPNDPDAWSQRLAACEQAGDEPALCVALDAYLATAVGGCEARAAAAVRRIELADVDDHATVLRAAAAILPAAATAERLSDDEELVIAILAGRLDLPEQAQAAATLLLPTARAHQRWDEVLRCVEVLSADAEVGSPEHVAALLDQADLAHGHADNGPLALAKAAEAVSFARTDLAVWTRALAIADARADSGLDATLDAESGLSAGAAPNDALLRLVATRAATSGDAKRAIAAWTALRALAPAALESYEALEALHRDAGDLDAVADVLTSRLAAGAVDPAGAAPDEVELTWLRLSMLHADERGAPQDAVAALKRGLVTLPDSELLWAAWLELASGDVKATREALEARLAALTQGTNAAIGAPGADSGTDSAGDSAAASAAVIVGIHRDLATLLEDEDGAAATGHWMHVLAQSPDDAEVAARAGAALLSQADPGLPATSHAMAETIAARLEALGQDDLRDAVLQAWAAGAETAVAVTLQLRRAAADPKLAFERLAGALITSPGQTALINALDEAADASGVSAAARAEAWAEAAAAAPEAARPGLQLRGFRAQVEDEATREVGLAAWTALWRDAPSSVVFDDLIAALTDAGQPVSAQTLRLERLEAAPAGLDVRAERTSLAAAFAASGDRDSAQAQLQQLVVADPTDADTVAALRALAESDDERNEVDGLLAIAADEIADLTARNTLRRDLAERALAREAWHEAAELLDAALADAPEDDEAFTLRDLALGAMAPDVAGPRLSAHLSAAVARSATEPQRRDLRLRLADHEANYGAGPAAAFVVLRDALAEAPAEERIDLLMLAVATGSLEASDADVARTASEAISALLQTAASDKDAAYASTALRTLARRQPTPELAVVDALRAAAIAPSEEDEPLLRQLWLDGARAPELVDALLLHTAEATARVELLSIAVEVHGPAINEAWLVAWSEADPSALAPRAMRFALAPTDGQRWQALTGVAAPDAVLDALLGSLEWARSPNDQAEVLIRAAELAASADDAETAAAYLGMALEHRDDPAVRAQRRDLLLAAGANEGLADALEAEADASEDPEQRRKLLTQALDLWTGGLANPGRAASVFARIRALAPNDPTLLVRGIALQRAAGDPSWRDAAIAAVNNPETTSAVSRRLAVAAHLASDQAEAAFAVAKSAVDSDGAASLGDELVLLSEQAEELPASDGLLVLQWQLEFVDAEAAPEEWASLKLRWLTRCDDTADQLAALDALIHHAMGPLGDADLAADWSIRALLLAPHDRERVMMTLAHADTDARRDAVLPAAHHALAVAGDDVEADLAAFAALLDVDRPGTVSAELLVARAAADPTLAGSAVSAFTELFTERGLHTSLIDLRRAALVGTSGHGRVSGLIELADAVAEQGEVASAIAALLNGCADVDEPELLIERAQTLAEQAGDPKAFVEAVERGLGGRLSVDAATEGQLVAAAAGSAAADLEDPSRAADLYNHLWERDPDNLDARDAVLAFRRAAHEPARLIDELDRALMQGGEGLAELRVELAGLLVDGSKRTEEAMRHLEAVLRDQPAHAEAAATLERIADGSSHVAAALRALELTYRAQEDWSGVTSVLRRRVLEAGSDAAATRQLSALAEVLENHVMAPGLAADVWARLVLVEPTRLRVRSLLRLAPAAEDQSQLTAALDAALGATLTSRDRIAVLETALAASTDDVARTEALLRMLIAQAPSREAAWERLDTLLEEGNRWEELVDTLHVRIATTKSDADRVGLQHRLAGLARASGQQTAAIDAYEAIAAADPTDPDPLEALVEMLEDGDPAKQCDALERWATRLPATSPERGEALIRAARMCAGPLNAPDRAAAHYLQAFDLNPTDDEAFHFVERHAAGNPTQLQRLYRRRAEGVAAGPARVVVLRKLANVCVELGKTGEARAALETALASDERNEVLQRELIGICEDANDVAGFQRAATHRLKFDVPRVERVMLVRKLARHAVEQGQPADQWLDELKLLAPDDPERSALRGLVQARSDDPETAAAGLERMVDQTPDDAAKVDLLWRLCELYDGKLAQPTQALSALQRLLQIAPGHWLANEKLCTLYAARGSQEALAESLRHWATATDPADSGRAVVLAQLGAVYLQLNRGAEAVDVLEEAYALTKDDITINLPLAMVWATLGRFEDAARLQDWVVDRLRRTRDRAQLPAAAARAGMLCERVGRHKDALKHYRTALKGAPGDVDATLGLARVSSLLGDDNRAMIEFEKVATMGPRHAQKSDRAQALLEIGRLHKKLGRSSQARLALNRALELQPDLRDAIDALRDA